jgi:DNA-binding transcriptional ArsR family regulator
MPTKSSAGSACFDPEAVAVARKLIHKRRKTLPRMADLYKLLANPVRLKILLSLGDVPKLCVGDLAQVVGLSIPATSHQLKMLKDRGWLHTESDGKLVYYSLVSKGLKEALEGDLLLLSK